MESSFLSVFEFEFAQLAFVAMVLITILCGLLSPMVVLKQRSYVGDALSHLIFPGVVAGILWARVSGMPMWTSLFIGAIVTALMGTFVLEWLVKVLKIPSDASAIISLTSFVAMGIIAISSHQSSRISPESILFGDVLTLNRSDVVVIAIVCVSVLAFLVLFKKHWDAWLSDAEFAQVMGFKVHLLDRLFPIMLTLSVLSGLFAVGGFMISALITIPAVLCQPRSAFSPAVVLVSTAFGVLGIFIAFYFNWPVGPSIVVLGFLGVILKTAAVQLFRVSI